jgi:hypothetical protein
MASGDTLCRWRAQEGEPIATANYATLTTRNYHYVLEFDDTTDESIAFSDIMPQNYASGGITAYIHYAMETATTGDIDWDIAFERIGDDVLDIDAASFAAVNSTDNTTVLGTAGNVDIVSIAFSNGADMDSVASGESFRISLTRDADQDTATGDAEVLGVELRET